MSSASEDSSTRSASPTPSNVRKRSHDEMNNINDEAKASTNEKPTNDQGSSTQNALPSQIVCTETEQPPSEQHAAEDHQDGSENAPKEAEDPDESDPAETISDLNWEDLEQRYHDMIKDCEKTESDLLEEWNSLIKVIPLNSPKPHCLVLIQTYSSIHNTQFFKTWTEAGHSHETDRTYKRYYKPLPNNSPPHLPNIQQAQNPHNTRPAFGTATRENKTAL